MRKYCFFIIFAAALLCGCNQKNGVADYIDSIYSPLTEVTTAVTETPADTYSEYMATYTEPSETDTGKYYYHVPPNNGMGMESAARPDMPHAEKPDTGTQPPMETPPKAEKPDVPAADTAPQMDIPAPDSLPAQTTVPHTAMTQFTESTETASDSSEETSSE